jgi:hypothetical protein
MTQSAIYKVKTPLLQRWQDAWQPALEVWSKYTRLSHPQLCASRVEAARQGLNGSFAMIRLLDQRVVIDLAAVEELGLQNYAVEVLAHEIGHHVLVPGSVTEQFRLLARIRKALPTLEQYAPMVANLYADLIINDRLQRQSGLRLADIYRALVRGADSTSPRSEVWNLYLRIYENLWKLEPGNLGAQRGDERSEGDAWLGARLVRVYATDWLSGSGRFATLLLHYLVEDAKKKQPGDSIRHLLDMADAAAGCEPVGGAEMESGEADGAIHPAEDPLITGVDGNEERHGAAPNASTQASRGQAREPFEYGEILRGLGIRLNDHEAAVRYYRERALPHLIPFPQRRVPDRPEPQLEGLEPWEAGDPLDEIDWLQSVMQSPRVIPGLTTVRRQYGQEQGHATERRPVDLDLYVDSSGSMPNPQREISYLSLAGAVIALSALRAGSLVQVTLWSGKNQYMHTRGFVRDEAKILRVLTGFYGGATAFPIHRLRETHCGPTKRPRPVHILMISDDGITTMFDRDEHGNDGWELSAKALAAAGAGGTMALNISPQWETAKGDWGSSFAELKRARREQGWEIFAISQLEDLMEFARAFSRKHYT